VVSKPCEPKKAELKEFARPAFAGLSLARHSNDMMKALIISNEVITA